VIRQVIEHEEVEYRQIDQKTIPAWTKKAFSSLETGKKKKLPAWANPSSLPPLVVPSKKKENLRLSDHHVEEILQVLISTAVTSKHPLLDSIVENIPETNRDAFAWKLFELWKEAGAASKDKWAMGSIGHIGGDQCVMKLTPMIRVWPGESQHARAVFGLQCLRGVGSSTALMQLSSIAQKLKFKGLKTKAALFVEQIAEEKGMTRAQLEDRVIPDCGLDENGKREFSFGPRSFFFVLGGDLKPKVKDETGKVRAAMPKPGVKDDQEVAEKSLNEWKLIKKQIKEVATLQSGRLEQAMVTGRRWSTEDFEDLLVKHPLMTHLVQKLVWGSFDSKGTLKTLFRVTEEKDFASVEDEEILLEKSHQVGLVHPLELTENQKSTWGEVLSDYEIVSPFPQLAREVYSLEKTSAKSKNLDGFEDIKLAAPTMVFTLEKLSWTRGEALDAGCFDEHSKQFPAANVTAVIRYEGVAAMGYIDPDETLEILEVYFCSGLREPSGYADDQGEKKMTLKDVSPVVVSEVIADLQFLRSKIK